MTLWLDAQLSPRIARWGSETFDFQATPVRELNLRESEDEQIFFAARKANVIVITKRQRLCGFAGTARQSAQNHLAHLRQHFGSGVEANSFIRAARSHPTSRFRRRLG